ncbi:MAG: hypothetical protein IJ634_06675 [Bacteroidales bacterium]|nr:hypothetical protein [Bacteroidales bacterium]
MTREEQRNNVICSCIQQQEHIASIAKQEMDSAQQQSNDYGANVDRYDAYRTKMMRSRDMYAKQLSNALAGIRALQELQKLPPFDTAEHGAIVVTDRQQFFLSIGAGKFMVGNRVFFAISAQTPIYMAVKGRRVGESFVINGQTQTIKEIY